VRVAHHDPARTAVPTLCPGEVLSVGRKRCLAHSLDLTQVGQNRPNLWIGGGIRGRVGVGRIRRQGGEWDCREAKQSRQGATEQGTHARDAISIHHYHSSPPARTALLWTRWTAAPSAESYKMEEHLAGAAEADADTMTTRIIRRILDRQAQDAETYRYWHSRTPAERAQAVFELTRDGYAAKGIDVHVERSERHIASFQRTRR
jgi:hypothetical protein